MKLAKNISLLGSYTHIKWLTPALEGAFRPSGQTPETSAKQVELNVQLSDSIKSAVTATQELSTLDENNGFEQFMAQALEQHIAAYFDLLEFPLDLKELLLTPLSSSPDPDATESMVVKLLEYSANPDVAH